MKLVLFFAFAISVVSTLRIMASVPRTIAVPGKAQLCMMCDGTPPDAIESSSEDEQEGEAEPEQPPKKLSAIQQMRLQTEGGAGENKQPKIKPENVLPPTAGLLNVGLLLLVVAAVVGLVNGSGVQLQSPINAGLCDGINAGRCD